jgi:hypothetical protein
MVAGDAMPIVVLKVSPDDDRYVLWSTTVDSPVAFFADRDELKIWFRKEGHSRQWIFDALKRLSEFGGDNGYGFDQDYIPVGEALSPPDGWWRIPRPKLPELVDRMRSGSSMDGLLERYA